MNLNPCSLRIVLVSICVFPSTGRTQQPDLQSDAPYQLNAIQQAFLDQVLENWELESKKINTFRCAFERQEYNPVFGPNMKIPFSVDQGELSFQKPDKGSFQITEIRRWQAQAMPPGQPPPAQVQGDWIKQQNAIGEHWVCDGKNVYEYRHAQKQVVVRPIPAELQGKAIADGPWPFLFGAEAKKLKQRYWIRVTNHNNPAEIWLEVKPKRQSDAANYQVVELILRREGMLPQAMKIHLPDGSQHLYVFTLAEASINAPFQKFKAFFGAPRKPIGWKFVTERELVESAQADHPVRQAVRPFGRTSR